MDDRRECFICTYNLVNNKISKVPSLLMFALQIQELVMEYFFSVGFRLIIIHFIVIFLIIVSTRVFNHCNSWDHS